MVAVRKQKGRAARKFFQGLLHPHPSLFSVALPIVEQPVADRQGRQGFGLPTKGLK
jgi:hypothetical protein